MKISEGRINSLSRQIAERLISEELTLSNDLNSLSKEVKRGFVFFLKGGEDIDQRVRSKISSLKRGIPEGSPEWDILYRQYYNEEIEKL